MTPKKQNPSPKDANKERCTFQKRMRNIALFHYSRIDARTVRKLQHLNLFGDFFKGEVPIGNDIDISVLQDPSHPRRIRLPDGPLMLYMDTDKESGRLLVEVPMLLLSDSIIMRQSALECLEHAAGSNNFAITPKTVAIIKKQRTYLLSNNENQWRRAAVVMYDAFCDDVLVALQGARQSIECKPVLQDSLNHYVPKVLHPTISSLDSIKLDINNPENEHEHLSEIIEKVVNEADTLAKACASYYEKLGYLPFAPRFNMVEVVQRWLAGHSDTNVWTEVWDWAHAMFGPLPRFHACCVFALHPEFVPGGRLPDLWNEILRVVGKSDREGANETSHDAWALRRDLARHYALHLEANLPDHDSVGIACFAWWFSERFTMIFPDMPEATRFIRENWVEPASDISSHIWLVASSRISRSFIRYLTLAVSSPWVVGLLSIMGGKFEQLALGEQSDKVRTRFHDAMLSHIISYLPFPVETPGDPTFALECSLAETVMKWIEYQPEEQKKALEELISMSQLLSTAEGVLEAIRKLGEFPLANQIAVALALKAKAYLDPTIAEGVWEVVSGATWRQEVLSNVETRVLALLIEALIILQVGNGDKWFSVLPHYIAELCEKADNDERREHLFLFTLYTSLASDTVSAVRRLLRGTYKGEFIKLVKEYRDYFESMRSKYPPWVTGKMRGLIANLRVV